MVMVSLDNPSMWFRACEQRSILFRCVMPMTMESLAITQHWDIL
jgi:hypothetical protein